MDPKEPLKQDEPKKHTTPNREPIPEPMPGDVDPQKQPPYRGHIGDDQGDIAQRQVQGQEDTDSNTRKRTDADAE